MPTAFSEDVAAGSPLHELLVYRHVARSFSPDLVILQLYIDNDVAGMDREFTISPGGSPWGIFDDGPLRIDYSDAEESYATHIKEPGYSMRKLSSTYRSVSFVLRKLKLAVKRTERGGGNVPPHMWLYRSPMEERWRSPMAAPHGASTR